MATVYWWAAGFSWLSLVIHADIVASDTKTDPIVHPPGNIAIKTTHDT